MSLRTIWMITKWYPNSDDPQLGVFIRKHAECISDHYRISVLYLHPSKHLNQIHFTENLQGNLHEVIVYTPSGGNFPKRIWEWLKAINTGLRAIKKVHPKPDLFHGYILLRTGLIARMLSIRYGKPYVISEQWSGYATGKYKTKGWIYKSLCSSTVAGASAFSSVSRFLQENLHRNGLKNRNESVIGNVTGEGKIQDRTPSSVAEVLVVADLVDKIKNISGVLKMIGSLPPETLRRFRLRIIGGGEDEAKLKQLSSELRLNGTVFFEGLKRNEEVYEYLYQTDFLIMNSRFETFSSICIEAFSCGVPVIATDCGGPSEFVGPEQGILIPPDSEVELKRAFLKMLDEHGTYDSKAIRAFAIENFSRPLIGKKFHSFYEKVL